MNAVASAFHPEVAQRKVIRVDTDILMITYNRPSYTRKSLARLLETCDEQCRVWVWHNGDDAKTVAVVRSFEAHPRFHRLHHSPENLKLREPTNWFWSQAQGDLIGKVDDDCLMPPGWIDALRRAHADVPEFGAIGCWPFREEDIMPEIAERKIRTFANGHRLMLNCWIGGSGYLLKRACLYKSGPLGPREPFSAWCKRAALTGWVHGWYYPLLFMDHMDDPRSRNCGYQCDSDFRSARGLSAAARDLRSIAEVLERQRVAAMELQTANPDPRAHVGWRVPLRRLQTRLSTSTLKFRVRIARKLLRCVPWLQKSQRAKS